MIVSILVKVRTDQFRNKNTVNASVPGHFHGAVIYMERKLMYTHHLRAGLLAAVLLLMTGCIGLKPLAEYARSGDTIHVNLGGLKRNAQGQVITRADLTVTLVDINGVSHNPPVVAVFRVFPDHTSVYAVQSQDPTDTFYGDLVPHDGALWASIRLVDRVTFEPLGNPVTGLPQGTALLNIDSGGKLTQTFKPNGVGIYTRIPLEILAGVTPQPNPWWSDLAKFQYLAYETHPHLTVKPSTAPATTVGGVQIEIIYSSTLTSVQQTVNPFELRLVPMHHDPNVGLIQSTTDNGDNTITLKAILTNPNGFVPSVSGAIGESGTYDLNLALVSNNGKVVLTPGSPPFYDITEIDIPTWFTITANSFYVDLNGDVIPGITPVLLNEYL